MSSSRLGYQSITDSNSEEIPILKLLLLSAVIGNISGLMVGGIIALWHHFFENPNALQLKCYFLVSTNKDEKLNCTAPAHHSLSHYSNCTLNNFICSSPAATAKLEQGLHRRQKDQHIHNIVLPLLAYLVGFLIGACAAAVHLTRHKRIRWTLFNSNSRNEQARELEAVRLKK